MRLSHARESVTLHYFPARTPTEFDTESRICETHNCCLFSEMLSLPPVPKWRNWQTRVVQVHVLARVWGFESLLRHQKSHKVLIQVGLQEVEKAS